jgi:HK97 family phage prohead protease
MWVKRAKYEAKAALRENWYATAEQKGLSAPQTVNERIVTGIASVFGVCDDNDDVVHPGAFRKTIKEQKDRVRYLWCHDPHQPPIAVIRELKEVGRSELPARILEQYPQATGGLEVTREYLTTPRAEEVLWGIKTGAINELSIGYNAIRSSRSKQPDGARVRDLTELRLLDVSDVPWGMNPATVASKGALPFHDTPKAAVDATWDGPAEVAKADVSELDAMCAWCDDSQKDVKGGYKLPHHEAGGEHLVVWAGVRAAMGALLGARGGVDIPDGDRRAVYEHLSKHYDQFGNTPPDYKWIQLADVLNGLGFAPLERKEGRRNSAADESQLRQLVDALQSGLSLLADLLGDDSIDPTSDDQPDNDSQDSKSDYAMNRALVAQLELRKRQFATIGDQ